MSAITLLWLLSGFQLWCTLFTDFCHIWSLVYFLLNIYVCVCVCKCTYIILCAICSVVEYLQHVCVTRFRFFASTQHGELCQPSQLTLPLASFLFNYEMHNNQSNNQFSVSRYPSPAYCVCVRQSAGQQRDRARRHPGRKEEAEGSRRRAAGTRIRF